MQGHGHSHDAPTTKNSTKRLVIILLIMLSVAALAWIPTLFGRGPNGGASHTATDLAAIFIPAWLTLTVGVVIISFWFFRDLVTSEKDRDSESVGPKAPAHH